MDCSEDNELDIQQHREGGISRNMNSQIHQEDAIFVNNTALILAELCKLVVLQITWKCSSLKDKSYLEHRNRFIVSHTQSVFICLRRFNTNHYKINRALRVLC